MRYHVKHLHCHIVALLLLYPSLNASAPGPAEKLAVSSSSSSSSSADTSTLHREALMPLIESPGIRLPSIDIWESIILPYIGIDGGLKTVCESEHIPHTTLEGHTHWVRSAHFNHNGTHIVTAGDDKTARIWHLPTTKLTLNQMILLWALDEQKNKKAQSNHGEPKPLSLNKIAQKYNVPQAIVSQVLATFAQHDQENIQKTFKLTKKDKKCRQCVIL